MIQSAGVLIFMQPLGQQLGASSARYAPRGCRTDRLGSVVSTYCLAPHALLRQGGSNAEAKQQDQEFDARIARRRRLEAVLLLAKQPLPLRRLAGLANLADGTEARTLLKELNQLYDARGCAFSVVGVAGGHQLLTREKLAPWVGKFVPPADDLRLSPPAMETLAVVAYRQPALRAEVEAIRGVQSGELLRQLMERELLRIVGRSNDLGRPLLYGTTKRFLQVFGLKNLEDLPRHDALRRTAAESCPA